MSTSTRLGSPASVIRAVAAIPSSTLYFCDVYWAAFREIDFLPAVRRFGARE